MTHDDVQAWLDSYLEAWKSYDPAAIGDLFTDDASYWYHPGEDPIVGRDEIVDAWVRHKDTPHNSNPWTAEYRPWAVDGDRAVVIGETHYSIGEDYFNCFQILFRGGKAAEFTEWFMEPRGSADAPSD